MSRCEKAMRIGVLALILVILVPVAVGLRALKISAIAEKRAETRGSSELQCDITLKPNPREKSTLKLAFAVANVSSNDVYLREAVLGYNLSVYVRKDDENSYWSLHPPGSYLQPAIKVISPGHSVATEFEWPFGNEKYHLYGEYSSLDTDTNVTWHGHIRTPFKSLHRGHLNVGAQ
jgi:hypothetical protein